MIQEQEFHILSMQDIKKKNSHVGYVINLQNVLISILLNEFGVSYSLVNSIEFGFKSNL